jgi:integrase
VAELVRAAWALDGRPELEALRLRAWAHMLGFRGHWSTKSRRCRLVWRPAVEQVGLDGLRVNDLRHTAATVAAAAGATTKELMERMGHTSPAVALRYQHVMADRQAQLASALDDLAQAATAKPKGTRSARRRR